RRRIGLEHVGHTDHCLLSVDPFSTPLTLRCQGCRETCGQASDLGIQVVPVSRLRNSSHMCSDDELHVMSGPALLDRTRDLVAERNRIDAELARTVRVADSKRAFAGDGMKTPASWLRGHCRLSKSAASQVVRTGRALEQLPAVEEAHATGQLTAD